MQQLSPDTVAQGKFSYERELQAFLDRKRAEKPSTCTVG